MPKVRMLKLAKGSEDGITIATYYEGKEYVIGDDLLQSFIEQGACELVEEKAVKPDENKALNTKMEDKSKKKK